LQHGGLPDVDYRHLWGVCSGGLPRSAAAAQIFDRFRRFDTTPAAEVDEFSNVNATATRFSARHPPLTLPDSVGKLALGQTGLLPQFAKKNRNLLVNAGMIAFRSHRRKICAARAKVRFAHILLDARCAYVDNPSGVQPKAPDWEGTTMKVQACISILLVAAALLIACGRSSPPSASPTPAAVAASQTAAATTPRHAGQELLHYVASSKSTIYHLPTCQWAQKISPANLVTYASREDAEKAGLRPCKVCKP
jgi:hypothetical protein